MSYSTLVSCAQLASHLDNANWRVFDCRHQLSDVDYGARVYAEGHLPGAFFLHLDRDLSSPMNGRNGRHPWPDAQRLADTLGAAGVTPTTQVVVYDDAGGMVAARLWYLLRWLGHERVALLDGGFGQWVKEGRPLSTELPTSAPAVFAESIAPRDGLLGADAVLANIDRGELLLVDARAADRFRGENETIDPVGGHIPGAANGDVLRLGRFGLRQPAGHGSRRLARRAALRRVVERMVQRSGATGRALSALRHRPADQ